MLRLIVFGSFFLATFFLGDDLAMALPSQVVIVRHGEKPAQGNELSPEGCERAFLLPGFFTDSADVNRFGSPVAIYSQRPNHDSGSLRPIQTMIPAAETLHLPIHDNFVRKDLRGVSADILSNPNYNGRTVLVAWEHEVIPDLAQAFGLNLPPNTKNWPDHVYDEAWILTFTPAGIALEIVPERVLPTDNPLGGTTDWKARPQNQPSGSVDPTIAQRCQTNNLLNSVLSSLLTTPLPIDASLAPN